MNKTMINTFVIIFINVLMLVNKNTAVHCSLSNVNKYNFWF